MGEVTKQPDRRVVLDFPSRRGFRGRAARPGAGDPLRAWREACDGLVESASTLRGDPLAPRAFRSLLERVRALEELHGPVTGYLNTRRAEDLVAGVAESVAALAERDAPWLAEAVEAVHVQWKLAWLAGDEVDLVGLERDANRLRQGLREALAAWRAAEDEKAVHRRELQRIDDLDPVKRASLDVQLELDAREADLHRALAAANRRAGEALRRVLQVVGPAGEEFDPARDYGREWVERAMSRDPGADPAAAGPGPEAAAARRGAATPPNAAAPGGGAGAREAAGNAAPAEAPLFEALVSNPLLRPEEEAGETLARATGEDPRAPHVGEEAAGAGRFLPDDETEGAGDPSTPPLGDDLAAGGPEEGAGPPAAPPPGRERLARHDGGEAAGGLLDPPREAGPPASRDEGASAGALPDRGPSGERPAPGGGRTAAGRAAAPPREEALAALWQAIGEGRPGFAYHVARLLGADGEGGPALPPAELAAAVALAGHVQCAHDPVATALRPHLVRLAGADLARDDPELHDALHLTLLCATLRPALFAPRSGAAALLRQVRLSDPLRPVGELAAAVGAHAQALRGLRLDAALLDAALSPSMWSERFEDFTVRVRDWRRHAAKWSDPYRPAQRAWTRWLRAEGGLAELVARISKADAEGRERVRELYEGLADRERFAQLLPSGDGRPPGVRRGGGGVGGRTLERLRARARPVLDLAGEWLRLMDAKSSHPLRTSLGALRQDLDLHGFGARAALDMAARSEPSAPLAAALAQSRRSLDALLRLFAGAETEAEAFRSEADPAALLSQDLLCAVDLALDAGWRPAGDPEAALARLLDRGAHAPDLASAGRARLEKGDLAGARLACERLKAEGDPGAEALASALDRAALERRRERDGELAKLTEEVEGAFHLGHLDPAEYHAFALRVAMMRVAPGGAEAPERVPPGAARVRRALAARRLARSERARVRLEGLRSATGERGGPALVARALRAGDLARAGEMMDRIDDGEPAAAPAAQDDTFGDFLRALRRIEGPAKLPDPGAVVRAAHARQPVAGVRYEALSEPAARQAARLLHAWYTLSREELLSESGVGEFLSLLGFRVLGCTLAESGPGRAELAVETEPLQDRLLCPLPHFGSAAKGRYRLVLDWGAPGTPAAESVARALGDGRDFATSVWPRIVLHFGRLGPDRERLRAWALARRRLFLVVDESLLLFLSGRRSGRLLGLFRCALPFSAAEPFPPAPAAGPTAPEHFFGRTREREAIMDVEGACFVYGGHGIGKTALLRLLELDFHNPRGGQLIRWIDIEAREPGHAGPPERIWLRLWSELRKLEVIPKGHREPDPGSGRQIDALAEGVEGWVNAHRDRRLVLLFDRADAFLDRDGRAGFRESARFRRLMDRTGRRFKVVFCGLHRVLRIAGQAGHPLAAFGDPIRIGPMYAHHQWERAQAMIRDPLQAAGCRFEREHLGACVASRANHEPALIQLFGSELVRRVRDSGRSFPYRIGIEDVDAVSRGDALHRAMREGLLRNLRLDPRYEVIARAMAGELLGQDEELAAGFEIRILFDLARSWWPEGFALRAGAFEALLREMRGLGILRAVQGGRRYQLRNPKLLPLLADEGGNEEAPAGGPAPAETFAPDSGEVRLAPLPEGSRPAAEAGKGSGKRRPPLFHRGLQLGRKGLLGPRGRDD